MTDTDINPTDDNANCLGCMAPDEYAIKHTCGTNADSGYVAVRREDLEEKRGSMMPNELEIINRIMAKVPEKCLVCTPEFTKFCSCDIAECQSSSMLLAEVWRLEHKLAKVTEQV